MADIITQFRLDGTVALVTGASRGIGKAIALGFALAGRSAVAPCQWCWTWLMSSRSPAR